MDKLYATGRDPNITVDLVQGGGVACLPVELEKKDLTLLIRLFRVPGPVVFS